MFNLPLQGSWEDVYLKFRLGRRRWQYLGPCFQTTASLEESLASYRRYQTRRGDDSYAELIAREEAELASLATVPYGYTPLTDNCSEVTVPEAAMLSKANVEPAIRWLLATHYGLTNVKLKWARLRPISRKLFDNL